MMVESPVNHQTNTVTISAKKTLQRSKMAASSQSITFLNLQEHQSQACKAVGGIDSAAPGFSAVPSVWDWR